jgi:predicted dehydrogenase
VRGHFIDAASWWFEDHPVTIFATRTPSDPDNLITALVYPDGSLAKIAYVTTGDFGYPKETLEIFGDDKGGTSRQF